MITEFTSDERLWTIHTISAAIEKMAISGLCQKHQTVLTMSRTIGRLALEDSDSLANDAEAIDKVVHQAKTIMLL